ncbi:MAG: ATP-binding protein [Planctomycetota bacterium]
MIRRHLREPLQRAAAQLPVVTLTGPRQSGKTTLVRDTFPAHAYVSLEDPEARELARADPHRFLGGFPAGVILDEAQRAPDLFSHVQILVDEDPRPGRFVLTGSENFLLAARISQSLAGRCAVLHLLPFSLGELRGRPAADPAELDGPAADRAPGSVVAEPGPSLDEVLFQGFYPRVHHPAVEARTWLAGYVSTYVERDVRQVANVGELEVFQRFLRLCAGRTGQLLNLSSLANDTGISAPTVRAWLSILGASFLVHRLPSHFANFQKRLIKSPKLHFLDSGLLCYLLGIRSAADLSNHPLRGAIFESFVVSELLKSFVHRGEKAPLYFWRDRTGHEIDLLVDLGRRLVPWEIKSAETVPPSAFAGVSWWRDLPGNPHRGGGLVHGGDQSLRWGDFAVRSWRDCS